MPRRVYGGAYEQGYVPTARQEAARFKKGVPRGQLSPEQKAMRSKSRFVNRVFREGGYRAVDLQALMKYGNRA